MVMLVHVWWWLQANNLLKAVVAWSVGLALNSVWAVRLWVKEKRRMRENHAAVMDKLDTGTPGGLGEIRRILVADEQDPDDDNGSDPDDNGRDPSRDPSDDSHRRSVNSVHSSTVWPDIMHGVKGGDTGAGHR